MEPTNDPSVLGAHECTIRCPECAKSLCLQDHENWKCRCGHSRGYHLSVSFFHWGYWPTSNLNHPHPCIYANCDCEGLWYVVPADLISNADAIAGLLEVVEDLQ